MLTAKVRVMRSYDYNHFEVEIGSDECKTIDDIDDLRKQAAILVDDAIRQYKIAKKKESARESKEWQYENALARIKGIKSRPKEEWTVEDAALLRSGMTWTRRGIGTTTPKRIIIFRCSRGSRTRRLRFKSQS